MMKMRKTLGVGLALGAAVAGLSSPAGAVTFGTFTGGDVGDGLDLDGNFVYAVNVRGPATGLAVRDAVFTVDTATPGVTVASTNEIVNWHAPNYGATANDNNLETVMQSIRWSSAPNEVVVTANGLLPGRAYKLQLLFADNLQGNPASFTRNFDVLLEGNLLVDNYVPGNSQIFASPTTAGAVITEQFIAGDNQLNVRLTPTGAFGTPGSLGDNNAILQGFTLELIPIPEPATCALLALSSLGFIRRRRAAQ